MKRILTEEHKLKISLALKGKPLSMGTREKLSAYASHRSVEHREKLSLSNLGKKLSDSTKKKISINRMGKYTGEENVFSHYKPTAEHTAKRISALPRGENHWNWKGGITSETEKIRKSHKHTDWSKLVRKIWNYECQICGYVGDKLEANHIIKFSDDASKRFEVENGVALCKNCHKKLINKHETEWESYFKFCWENKRLTQSN